MHPTLFAALVLIDLPGMRKPGEHEAYRRPTGSTDVHYFEWLETNAQYIYPLIAVVVVGLLALGIIMAWRTDDLDGVQKAELKREIIRILRRDVYGTSADRISKTLNVPGGKLMKLLEEMAEENLVESRTDTSRVTTWRMKGLAG